MVIQVEHRDGVLTIEPSNGNGRAGGGNYLRITPRDGVFVPSSNWLTKYSESLVRQVLSTKGLPYLIDEIRRDEDPRMIERALRVDLLSYLPEDRFEGARILDFGCGSGASTMVLARMFRSAKIVGVELNGRHLETARERAAFYGVEDRVEFIQSPSPESLPEGIGLFDHVLFCAVFEHLLPHERAPMMAMLWKHVAPGGHLFINDTPNRWFPIETHTTSLPLINYLPDRAAFYAARRFSSRIKATASDQELLRLGIRGGTTREILRLLPPTEGGHPELLEPNFNGVDDQIALWAKHSENARGHRATAVIVNALRAWRLLTGAIATPSLSLAIRKAQANA